MLQSHPARDPLVRLQGYHLAQQVDGIVVHVLDVVPHWDAFPLRELALEITVLQRLWPVVLVGSALHLEDFENLIDF